MHCCSLSPVWDLEILKLNEDKGVGPGGVERSKVYRDLVEGQNSLWRPNREGKVCRDQWERKRPAGNLWGCKTW